MQKIKQSVKRVSVGDGVRSESGTDHDGHGSSSEVEYLGEHPDADDTG